MRRTTWLMALLVWVPLLLAATAPPADAQVSGWTARLTGLSASYGVETWKYEVGYAGTSPQTLAAHVQNQSASYAGAVGLRLRLTIEVYHPDGSQPAPEVGVTAHIATTRGNVPAYVQREGNSRTFTLDFDLDGANNVSPDGRTIPAVEPGIKTVEVEVFRRVNENPPTIPIGSAQLVFTYEIPYQEAYVPHLATDPRPYVQPVPDAIFRLFNDIGWDRSVLSLIRPLNATGVVSLTYDFTPAAAGRSVELYGFLAERGVPQDTPAGNPPAPVPNAPYIPGVSDNPAFQGALDNTDRLVVVHKRLLATAQADDVGRATFALRGTDLLAVRSPAPGSGLVVVAPLLPSNFNRELCPGDCKGGPQFRIGATELVAPISDARLLVDRYRLADPGLAGNTAPDPVREAALGVNALQVYVREPGGFAPPETRAGDLFALVPDARSTAPLSAGSLSPSQSETAPGQTQNELLQGNLPVRGIQSQHVSFYRVMALVYRSGDVFHGLTYGDRGYELELSAPQAFVPPGDGGVFINFTSRTTNYNQAADEPGFSLRVLYRLRVPEFNINEQRTITLPESGFESVFLPLTATEAGSADVIVNATSGDVLPRAQTVSATWVEPPPRRNVADRLPGFEAPLALVALALLLGGRVRRR
jgi:hypothetical protein